MDTKYPLFDTLKVDINFDTHDVPLTINTLELDLNADGWLRLHCGWCGDVKEQEWMFKHPTLYSYSVGGGQNTLSLFFGAYEDSLQTKTKQLTRIIREIVGEPIKFVFNKVYFSKTPIEKFIKNVCWKMLDILEPRHILKKYIEIGIHSTAEDYQFDWSYKYFENLGYGINIYFSPKDWNSGEDTPVIYYVDDDYYNLNKKENEETVTK